MNDGMKCERNIHMSMNEVVKSTYQYKIKLKHLNFD